METRVELVWRFQTPRAECGDFRNEAERNGAERSGAVLFRRHIHINWTSCEDEYTTTYLYFTSS